MHAESSCTQNLTLGEEIATEWNVDRSNIAFLFERKTATRFSFKYRVFPWKISARTYYGPVRVPDRQQSIRWRAYSGEIRNTRRLGALDRVFGRSLENTHDFTGDRGRFAVRLKDIHVAGL